jgi:hypothetical protein
MTRIQYFSKYIQTFRHGKWHIEACVPTEAQKKIAEIGARPAYAYTSLCAKKTYTR